MQLTTIKKRRLSWALGVILAVALAIALVLLFLLALATNNHEIYEHFYPLLLGINGATASFLLLVLLWGGWRLFRRLRQNKFGSRLLIKLAALFCVVGILPGALIYFISYQFVSRSIEHWFDVRVERALTAGAGMASSTLDAWVVNTTARARYSATQLEQVKPAALGIALEQIREQFDASQVVLWRAGGEVEFSTGEPGAALLPERPSAQAFRSAREQREWATLEGMEAAEQDGEAPVQVQTLVLVRGLDGSLSLSSDAQRFLQITVAVPSVLVRDAFIVQQAHLEYQERAQTRQGLRRMYIGTLTLSLFLAVFGAILLAVVLGNRLLRPILILAEGVREVAAGNLTPKVALPRNDELSGLTRSFALMTHQLALARASEQKSLAALDASHGQLRTILDNLTAGVVVLDEKGRIVSTNPGATRVLRAPLAAYEGKPLADVPDLAEFAAQVWSRFDALLAGREGTPEHREEGKDEDRGEGTNESANEGTNEGTNESAQERRNAHRDGRTDDHWQHTYELYAPPQGASPDAHKEYALTIVTRGAMLPDGNRLLVFDDISDVVSAQRAQAWGEVARRLAHEIKNPLTPIQLSAERLEMRLGGKLPEKEEAVLAKSVKTIVDQVEGMKRLVDEFRDYARLPAARLQPLDLNALITDVLQLYGTENASFAIHAELDGEAPPILGDAMQLRQVIHNLLQNAQDASLQAQEIRAESPAAVAISTHWSASTQRVRLSVQDNGTGFAPTMLQRVFEPYVTTKAKGTGLGLAVVKKIADEHHALIDLVNVQDEAGAITGARVSLSFNAASAGNDAATQNQKTD